MSKSAVNKHSAYVFCITNQKGGVGKTTTAINLAAALSMLKKRVLLIDLDPQGNATMGSGIDKNAAAINLYQVLIGTEGIKNARQRSESGGYDVLPSNRELSGAEIDLIQMEKREQQLKQALADVSDDYDFILIDCPPTLSLLTLNGLASAHGVIIPMQCEYFALEGLSDLVNTVKRVYRNINPDLRLIGLLRVMFDTRVTLQQQVSAQIEAHFGDKVFSTIVPRNVRLAEAPSHGLPGVIYDPSSRGAKAYMEFGRELIKRLKKEAQAK
ncbi:ParA family protein [Alcaligenes endophyticus]|uniref:AAA family ATPase n=1 Tax=Alcaligenes endophyticus TaxID=1929088 RepID=A0ABT8EEX6_9BURK|nr:AAA family ATPase [Alcaligenes endophyticus]MCX5590500.1 AAA family ATPase [Alcaligenes endophyticus]MDN4119836.1 AAA family ATPase [Alcaligenes endophyticus]